MSELTKLARPTKGAPGVPTALLSSQSAEWYTPAIYVYAARDLMRGIDVDPASNAQANKIVRAATYYTQKQNGLNKRWHGRVWLNPPYGSQLPLWTKRLIEQYQAGITTEAVLLVNASTEAKWFQPLYDYPICFTDHRIKFYTTEGIHSQPTHGSAFVYFGQNRHRFIDIFEQFGQVVEAVSACRVPTLWDVTSA